MTLHALRAACDRTLAVALRNAAEAIADASAADDMRAKLAAASAFGRCLAAVAILDVCTRALDVISPKESP